MANMAKQDMEKRTVRVDRKRLLEALESNREQHVKNFQAAMAGYKETLLQKIDAAFADARQQLDARYERIRANVQALTEKQIAEQRDNIALVRENIVEMKVPRCFVAEYDAAIDMARWDNRDELDLTHAEFQCFVRDQWEWKSGFDALAEMYSASHIS